MTEQTPAVSEERGYRKALRGIVVSDKMDKTIVVEVEDRKKHSLYGKVLKTSKRVKAHDEENTARTGDVVRIMETRPLSARKRKREVCLATTSVELKPSTLAVLDALHSLVPHAPDAQPKIGILHRKYGDENTHYLGQGASLR